MGLTLGHLSGRRQLCRAPEAGGTPCERRAPPSRPHAERLEQPCPAAGKCSLLARFGAGGRVAETSALAQWLIPRSRWLRVSKPHHCFPPRPHGLLRPRIVPRL